RPGGRCWPAALDRHDRAVELNVGPRPATWPSPHVGQTVLQPHIPPGALAGAGGMGGWAATVVWSLVPERVPWRLCSPGVEVRYLKVPPGGAGASLDAERQRMQWLATRLPVPRVVDHGSDGAHEWLVTAAIDGMSAVDATLRADPRRLVPLLAEGL